MRTPLPIALVAPVAPRPSHRAARGPAPLLALTALVALTGLATAMLAPDVRAAIHKCVAPDGSITYTGTPCDALELDAWPAGPRAAGVPDVGEPAAARPPPRSSGGLRTGAAPSPWTPSPAERDGRAPEPMPEGAY